MGMLLNYKPRPRQTVAHELCDWHSAIEGVAAGNWRIMCAWQRVILRAMWGL